MGLILSSCIGSGASDAPAAAADPFPTRISVSFARKRGRVEAVDGWKGRGMPNSDTKKNNRMVAPRLRFHHSFSFVCCAVLASFKLR